MSLIKGVCFLLVLIAIGLEAAKLESKTLQYFDNLKSNNLLNKKKMEYIFR